MIRIVYVGQVMRFYLLTFIVGMMMGPTNLVNEKRSGWSNLSFDDTYFPGTMMLSNHIRQQSTNKEPPLSVSIVWQQASILPQGTISGSGSSSGGFEMSNTSPKYSGTKEQQAEQSPI